MSKQSRVSLTNRKLIEMLTENTGRHMLDSGGAYGRNWERNQHVNFANRPRAVIEVSEGYQGVGAEILVTLDLYHWLSERVEYAPDMQRKFSSFVKRTDPNGNKTWFENVAEWMKYINASDPFWYETRGEPVTVNTYNGEDMLSQTIQYTYFRANDDTYIALFIHGGCDVRGGYTAPKIFRASHEDTYSILDNTRANIWGETLPDSGQDSLPGIPIANVADNWMTDDSCHWYHDGACGLGAGRQLEDYEVSNDPFDRGAGKIYVDDNGVAYSPLTGARLVASSL